jgi:hypothetical protein
MKTKHTAGEWYAKDGQIYPIETGKTFALIPFFEKGNEEQEANQQLISAAPWMLSALIEAVEHCHVYDTNPALIQMFSAVINKATGNY